MQFEKWKQLSIDKILKDCPAKLLALYPMIVERIRMFQETPDYLREELEPLIIMVKGSRASGKSEWAQRSSIAGIYDGYINKIKYATMTENGLNGSKDAFERLAPECIGTGANTSKFQPMHRYIGAGRVDFDFFGKADIKNEQKKYDMLICEEVEKWDKVQGVAALETEIRHCCVIILISNNPPQSVVDFVKMHAGIYLECNWWDNRALPAHIKEAYSRAQTESPVYYSRFIMCQNDVDAAPWFEMTGIENFLSRRPEDIGDNEKEFNYVLLGIDVGGGYGDDTIIAKISKNTMGCLFVEVLGKYQLESPQVCVKVGQQRALTGAIEEVWDANGIGLTTMQQRAPDARSRNALGVVPFVGNGPASPGSNIFNQRSEAYAIWARMINDNQCWYIGNPTYIDQIKREMYAQIYAPAEQSKGTLRLAEKKEIKKNLNGESPNIADAIAMGIWRIMTHRIPAPTTQSRELLHGGVRTSSGGSRWF